MSANALLILAEGAEEMEVVITVDVLRRAGIEVTIAGLSGGEPVKCSRNVVIVPDVSLTDAISADHWHYDVIILPGGLGSAQALSDSDKVGDILRRQEASNGLIGAICAAPIAFINHGIALHKSVTSHPSKADQLIAAKYDYSDKRVVVDGQVITSRGPGTAFEFALAIVEKLCGLEKVDQITPPMILP